MSEEIKGKPLYFDFLAPSDLFVFLADISALVRKGQKFVHFPVCELWVFQLIRPVNCSIIIPLFEPLSSNINCFGV